MDKILYVQVFQFMTEAASELIVDYEFSKDELGKEENQAVEIFKELERFSDKNPGFRYGITLGATKEDIIRIFELFGEIIIIIGDLYGKLLKKGELNELENRFVENMNKISREFMLAYNYTRNSLGDLIKQETKGWVK